jgi:hypothetical protein
MVNEAQIEDGVIVNLLASLVISLLISIEQQIPPHKTKARAVRKVEDALRDLAKLNSLPITANLLKVGVKLWNKCIEELQDVLEVELIESQEIQLQLFMTDGRMVEYHEYIRG